MDLRPCLSPDDGGQETARKWKMVIYYPSLVGDFEYQRIIPLQVMILKPLESVKKDSKSKRGNKTVVVINEDVAENEEERRQYLKKLQKIQVKQMAQWKRAPLAALKFQVEQYRTLGAEF